MAQTIAIQRGELSLVWNNALYTIFTQSTGTATRVIFGGMNCYSGGSPGANVGMMTFIQNSTANRWTPVSIWSASKAAGQICGFLTFPSQSSTYRQSFAGSTILQTNAGNSIGSQDSTGYIGGNSLNSVNMYGGNSNTTFPFGTVGNMDQQPAQFWMGSGDSLVIRVISSSSSAAFLAYNFVTITES